MDEQYLLAAVRYVELNPVRAKLCAHPNDWKWSSARAHLLQQDDGVVNVQPMLERARDWAGYLSITEDKPALLAIRKHSVTGRPAGCESFINCLEALTGRSLKKAKPGPKTVIK
jgi:putative transposase